MKISCILSSYNRPRFIRQALKSVADQTHHDYELVVIDESTLFDVQTVIQEHRFPKMSLHRFHPTPNERLTQSRLSVNVNAVMSLIAGDIVCFLCDDDYYFPDWFESANAFFEGNPDKDVCYGKLYYSNSENMEFPKRSPDIFSGQVISKPLYILDHNQVMHRRFCPPFTWPEGPEARLSPDGMYFTEVAKKHLFHPLSANAVVKRLHGKMLNRSPNDVEGLRE